MKRKLFVLVILFFQLLFFTCSAQNNELRFNLVLGPDGKPLGSIRSITQDRHGYMWFAAQVGKCIYRYDGNRFTVFRHDDSNPNSLGGVNINSIYADDAGMIWVGMGEGLDQYNPATGIFKHYRHESNDRASLSEGITMCQVLKDRQGRLWVGTGNGLDRLDEQTGKFIHYRNEPGNPKSLSNNVVWKIYEDRHGVIWIGTGFPFAPDDDGGLNRLNSNGTFTRYMHDPKDEHSIINNKVLAIYEDCSGIFWVGTGGDGLHIMDRKSGRFERHLYDPQKPEQLSRPPLKPREENDRITSINEDSTGAIWIGTVYSGINRYDTGTKKITHYEHSNGFPDTSCWNAFSSRDGTLWIATQQDNLYRIDPPPKTISTINLAGGANCFLEDKEGFLWVGSNNSGLLKYDEQKKLIQQFNPDSSTAFSLFHNPIFALFQSQDTLWLGTADGIGIFNKSSKQFSRLSLGFKFINPGGSMIWNIFQDKQGSIWFAPGEGLISYDPANRSIKRYQSDEKDSGSIGSNRIASFLEDRSGTFWIGVIGDGINRLDRKTGRFRHYLKGFNGVCMYEDSQGTIWAGTDRGLYRYNIKDDTFSPFFDSQLEFSHEFIYGIKEDDKKNLWIITPSDIVKINTAINEIFIYGKKFGITPLSIHANSMNKTRAGQILIGHDNGYFAFFPEELAVNTNFKIIITDLFINTLPVLPGKGSPIEKPVEETSDLDLKYNQNNVAFNFSAIDYRGPEAIKYLAMLENYDNTWREVKGEKSSYYFNLPQGKYVYHVKAFNSEGTRAEKTIIISINPPWWQTGWAYVLYVLLLVLAIWSFIKWRTRVLNKEKITLEKKVATRTRELKNEKEIVESTLAELKATQGQLIHSEKMASLGELTAGIAHEIQNPLNFVNNFSELSKELIGEMNEEIEKGNYEEAKIIGKNIEENQEKINHHGKRADAIVKSMLQHSRTSSGQKEFTDINALVDEYLRLAYHGWRAKDKSFNSKFETDFDDSIDKMNIVSQDIGRVILNLINNAFYAVQQKQKEIAGKEVTPFEKLSPLYGPTVTVRTKKSENQVLISVSDNGNGMPKNIVDKIFQPFFTTKPTGQGTGLGLSLSYDVIKAHGGNIRVESKEAVGSTFIIEIPITQ